MGVGQKEEQKEREERKSVNQDGDDGGERMKKEGRLWEIRKGRRR